MVVRKLTGPRRLTALASLVVLCGVAVPLAARADIASIASIGQTGATATQQAVRLGSSSCTRVWVIGDSLTEGSAAALRSGLAGLGLDAYVVDGVRNRRISATSNSGVLTARSIRATRGEANCWVIALGTNDITSSVTTTALSRTAVSEMIAEVTPQARVWWVNVDVRSLDQSTRTFNSVLNERAAADLRFQVIDWYALAGSHPEWFVDAVHVNSAGYTARAALILDSIRRNSER